MARTRHRLGRCAALAVVGLLGLVDASVAQYMPSQTPMPPPFFALQGATVVTGSGSVIENATVVVANGLIEAVGADVQVPGDAWVIDVTGLYIYPGLFDGLSQVGVGSAPENDGPGAGGRTVSALDRPATSSWINAADLLDPEAAAIDSWRDAGFTNALVAPEDGIVTGQGAVINLAGNEAREMVVKTPAALRITMSGAGGFRSFPGSLMGVIAYVRQLFMDARHHDAYAAAYNADPAGQPRPKYDRALGPVMDAIAGGWPTVTPANEARQIRRSIKLGRDTGARVVIAGGHDAYALADEIAASRVPVLVDLDWPSRGRDVDPEAEEPLSSMRRRAWAPTTPARLEEAGATWAFYSGGLSGPGSVIDNVRKAIDNGLSEEAAVRGLTLAPARIFGVDAVLGSVEAGKIANLVVTDGPIFAEDTELRMVFVDGRKFDVSESSGSADEAGGEPPAVDLNGSWLISTNNDSEEILAELAVGEDGAVSGVLRSERGDMQIVSGTVAGNEFSFTATGQPAPGVEIDIVFMGTAMEERIEGTLVADGQFEMDFYGVRQPGGNSGAERGAR